MVAVSLDQLAVKGLAQEPNSETVLPVTFHHGHRILSCSATYCIHMEDLSELYKLRWSF